MTSRCRVSSLTASFVLAEVMPLATAPSTDVLWALVSVDVLLLIDDMTSTPRDGLRRSRARVDLDDNVLIASFATRLMMRWNWWN